MKRSVEDRIVGRLGTFRDAVRAGGISDKFTCRKIELDLKPKKYTGEDVRQVRDILGVSQAIFAEFIGVSAKAVQGWEQGKAPPHGAACRLMDEIRLKPAYWKDRLAESAIEK